MSKRRLLELVRGGYVSGWNDPRLPTIGGMRRRGYTPEAIRHFCRRIGVNKFDSTIDVALLEYCVREDLNRRAPRVMAVLRPLKVVITNYPEGQVEHLEAVNNPEDPAMASAVALRPRAVIEGTTPPGAAKFRGCRPVREGAPALRLLHHLAKMWSRSRRPRW
jgi:glutamyl/glutaminyl-tRNA synthetase